LLLKCPLVKIRIFSKKERDCKNGADGGGATIGFKGPNKTTRSNTIDPEPYTLEANLLTLNLQTPNPVRSGGGANKEGTTFWGATFSPVAKHKRTEMDRLAEELACVSVNDHSSSGPGKTKDTTPLPAASFGEPREVVVLDDPRACAEALGILIDIAQPIAVDFEGIALSRTGKLCLAQVAPVAGPVFLVDVAAMGALAFSVGRLGEQPLYP